MLLHDHPLPPTPKRKLIAYSQTIILNVVRLVHPPALSSLEVVHHLFIQCGDEDYNCAQAQVVWHFIKVCQIKEVAVNVHLDILCNLWCRL